MLRFAKGHGTGNDFVILPDPEGLLPLTPRLVAALCDRRRGIGADGVLRVVRTAAHADAHRHQHAAEWFMDYWNADGSVAEMCGNGVRVYARYLADSGLTASGPGTDVRAVHEVAVATRAGVVRAVVAPDDIAVGLTRPRLYGRSAALIGDRRYPGECVDVGNPHLVCRLDGPRELAAMDLSTSPDVEESDFPAGVNVEFVAAGNAVDGVDAHVRMRVYERGSGETLSCGSGACAVAAVALHDQGRQTGRVAVDVPGGRLTVTIDDALCWLAGPAVIVASGTVDPVSVGVRLLPETAAAPHSCPDLGGSDIDVDVRSSKIAL